MLLLLNTAIAWFMTGLIWFVQIVHYPLFDSVGTAAFQAYAERHRQLTTLVVFSPMVVEICTAALLAITWKRADGWLLWLCFALVIGIWISTALCSIPCHAKLCGTGYSQATHHWLVLSNWVRTLLWSARALILGSIICKILAQADLAK